MSKYFAAFLFLGFILTQKANAQSKKEQDLVQAVERLRKAMLDGDSSALMEMTAPALTYAHSSGKVENRSEFVGALASGRSDFISMDLSGQTVGLEKNTAIVRHLLTGKVMDNGKEGDVKLNIMQVWIKKGRRWQLLARQAARAS